MRSEISEFSYGYAVVHELNQLYKFIAPPHFPSLKEEGKAGGGYDVKIDRPGTVIYLQFKVAEEMKRRSAVEIKKHKLNQPPGNLTIPFYRMHMHRRDHSDQQKLLFHLNTLNQHVYYIAPRFNDVASFTAHYLSSEIVKNYFAFCPKDIGLLPDDKSHHVSYPKKGSIGWFCSEPRQIENIVSISDVVESIYANFSDVKHDLSTIVARELGNLLKVLDSIDVKPKWIDDKPSTPESLYHWRLGRIEFIARTYFDLCPIIIHDLPKD